MKIQIITIFCLLIAHMTAAQQEDQFTMFMQNKIGLNPAYAGVEDGAIITSIVRNQWLGFEGAPKTQLVNVSLPQLGGKVGLGGSIMHHTIGFTERYSAEIGYSYPLDVLAGELRLGIQTSVRYIISNFNQAEGTQPIDIDPSVPLGFKSKYVPNFGAGIYFSSDNVYLGFSVPRLLSNNIDFSDETVVITKEVLHAYLMGGSEFKLNENIKMNVNVLLKYVDGAPFDADVNINVNFMETFTVGGGYRLGGSEEVGLGESVSALMGIGIGENIDFGFAYDFTLSELKQYNSGSIEGFIIYKFGGDSGGGDLENPRNPGFFRK